MGVGGAGAAVVEDGAVGPGGDSLLARAVGSLQREVAEGDGCERGSELVVVCVTGDAVVGLGGIELRKVEAVVALAAVEGAGDHELELAECAAVGGSAFVGVEGAGIRRELEVVDILTVSGDDVDDGEERVASIERGDWAANDFDTLDHFDVNGKLGADHGFVVDVVVHAMAVDHEEDAGVEVAGRAKPRTPMLL